MREWTIRPRKQRRVNAVIFSFSRGMLDTLNLFHTDVIVMTIFIFHHNMKHSQHNTAGSQAHYILLLYVQNQTVAFLPPTAGTFLHNKQMVIKKQPSRPRLDNPRLDTSSPGVSLESRLAPGAQPATNNRRNVPAHYIAASNGGGSHFHGVHTRGASGHSLPSPSTPRTQGDHGTTPS